MKNKIIGFKYGILNNSRNYKIIFNEIICGNQKEDFGLVLYNNNQIQDLKIIQSPMILAPVPIQTLHVLQLTLMIVVIGPQKVIRSQFHL